MKKVTIAAFIIGSFIIYSFIYHANSVALVPNNSTNSGSSSGACLHECCTNCARRNRYYWYRQTYLVLLYKDGSYTGGAADAQWGLIQVKAIIQHGKITDVQFLQYPNERNRSVEINSYADPQLTSEAIQAQSANVDIVSGATDSSDAFIQSLSDALSQAKA